MRQNSKGPVSASHLKDIRMQRKMAAARLAHLAGVSRQTVYAIEDGSFVPNTLVALKLARALAVSVEDLFSLPDEAAAPCSLQAQFLAHDGQVPDGERIVRLIDARHGRLAVPATSDFSYLPVTDGMALTTASGSAHVNTLAFPGSERASGAWPIVLAGCDPGLSVLAHAARAAGVEISLVPASSRQAITWLAEAKVDGAGVHLLDPATNEYNVHLVDACLPERPARLITFALWQTGLVVIPRKAQSIRSISDLASTNVTIVNREKGSGSRAQLDLALAADGIPGSSIQGYGREIHGHLAAAQAVAEGWADCCFSTYSAARCYGLHFLPLQHERFDLVFSEDVFGSKEGEVVINLLNSATFRKRLEALAGYETSQTGRHLR